MSKLLQTAAITRSNLRSLPQRIGPSLVIVIAVAGVVGVLVSIMAMAIGFDGVMKGTGKPERVLVLAADAIGNSETYSFMSREAVAAVFDAPGIARDAENKPIASAEVVATIRFARADGSRINAPLRGVGPAGFQLRPEIKITAGRVFQPGLHELIVGAPLAGRAGLGLDSKVKLRNGAWTVVGIFTSGDSRESEMIGDADTVLTALQNNAFQSITARITSPESLATLKNALAANPQLKLSVQSEQEFYAKRSDSFGGALFLVGWTVGIIMALGALFGALNAMYATVAARQREIATLRAIGFNASAIVTSIFIETLILALSGGIIGAAVAGLVFNNHVISTMATGSNADGLMTFTMTVTPGLLGLAILWAAGIGLLGALFPAIRAARLPIATALQVR